MIPVVFLLLLALVFVIVFVAMRPTAEQKAVDKRLGEIRLTAGDSGVAISELDRLLKQETTGRFGWLEEMLGSFSFSQKLDLLLLQSGSQMTAGGLAVWSGGLAISLFLVTYMLVSFLPVALIVALAAAYAPIALLTFRRKRRVDAFAAKLPEAIDTMARSLHDRQTESDGV